MINIRAEVKELYAFIQHIVQEYEYLNIILFRIIWFGSHQSYIESAKPTLNIYNSLKCHMNRPNIHQLADHFNFTDRIHIYFLLTSIIVVCIRYKMQLKLYNILRDATFHSGDRQYTQILHTQSHFHAR